MKKLILALALCLLSGTSWAQCTGVFPPNTICGNNSGAPAPPTAVPQSTVTTPGSTHVGDLATWANTTGTVLNDKSPGVFNVRLRYGAVPDGSTDNSTAITNAFTAANAFSNGVPTVYFDCDTNTTTCVYNYGGSGTSPINPTVATTILCAPGATLNYTGTAHAADIGPGVNFGRDPYSVQGCRWTGGANFTAGLFFKNLVVNLLVSDNIFQDFGPSSPDNTSSKAAMVFSSNNFEPIVVNNQFLDDDGVPRNGVDAHAGTVTIIFSHNNFSCVGPGNTTCQTSPAGYGLWVGIGRIENNILQYHYPMIRITSQNSGPLFILSNHLEGNTSPSPFITYGDPGGGPVNISQTTIDNNFWYQTGANAGVPWVGPETPSSGSFALCSLRLTRNFFAAVPGSGAKYVNTNGCSAGVIWDNRVSGGTLFATDLLDTAGANGAYNVTQFNRGSAGSSVAGLPVMADPTNGYNLEAATADKFTSTLVCSSSSGANTYACNTSPNFNSVGTVTPIAGTMIVFTLSNSNTGASTINVNGVGAKAVQRGGAAVVSGDLVSGRYYLMVYDGTNWEMMTPGATLTYP
jgi:hypothetical protein